MKKIINIAKTSGKIQIVALLIVGLVMLSVGGFLGFPRFTQAAALTSVSDTLETSSPGSDSNHTIVFVTETGINGASETITLTFDDSPAFSLTGIIEDGIDIAEDTTADIGDCASFATEKTTETVASGTEWGIALSGQVITLTHPTSGGVEDIAAGACVQVEIGTHAAAFGTDTNKINNPDKVAGIGTADVMTIDINVNSGDDTGTAMVATIEGVAVSVTVGETLTVGITGVADTDCASITSGDGAEVTTTTSPLAVPFATPGTETFVTGCLDLQVTTNATDGYTTTVEKNQLLTSPGTDTIADGVCDATCSATVIDTFDDPSNNGFAYCMKDETGNAAETADSNWTSGANQCGGTTEGFKLFPTTTTTEDVMESAAATADDTSNTAYRLSISGDQTAGTYSATITYITTPTF